MNNNQPVDVGALAVIVANLVDAMNENLQAQAETRESDIAWRKAILILLVICILQGTILVFVIARGTS